MYNPDQYRLQSNWLRFPHLALDPIQIPFGLGLHSLIKTERQHGSGGPRLRLHTQGRQIKALQVQVGDTWRKLLPAFSRTVRNGVRGPLIRIDTASTTEEREAAKIIAARGHYLSASQRGLILIARIEDQRYLNRTRAAWWRSLDAPTRMRLGGTLAQLSDGVGNIVGALHIDRLLHGDPAGRAEIRKLERKRPHSSTARRRPGYRSKVVRELRLYWVSRVTVDAPFQRSGVGSILCDAAREVASQRMLAAGKYLELIRHMSIAEFDAVHRGKSDFLTGHSERLGVKLPFTLRTPYLSRKPMQAAKTAFGRLSAAQGPHTPRARREHCLAYYYAKAGPMIIGRRAKKRREMR